MLRIASQTVHSLDGSCVAAEVLARLKIGQAVLSPPVFMHGCTAESWYAMDIEVLKLVASSKDLRTATEPTFVNISPATLENETYLRRYCSEIASQIDDRKGKIVIEVPERSSLNGRELSRRLDAIQFTGAQIAIDDFGSEFASQGRLESHRWDYCKIDLAAIQNKRDLDWFDHAIRYCRDNGVQLIMEKLESLKDIDLMSPVKSFAWFQGYGFSRPEMVNTPNAVFGGTRQRVEAQYNQMAKSRSAC